VNVKLNYLLINNYKIILITRRLQFLIKLTVAGVLLILTAVLVVYLLNSKGSVIWNSVTISKLFLLFLAFVASVTLEKMQ